MATRAAAMWRWAAACTEIRASMCRFRTSARAKVRFGRFIGQWVHVLRRDQSAAEELHRLYMLVGSGFSQGHCGRQRGGGLYLGAERHQSSLQGDYVYCGHLYGRVQGLREHEFALQRAKGKLQCDPGLL